MEFAPAPAPIGLPADFDSLLDLGLCLSGGGYRALLFHSGVLTRLNEAGMLPKLDMISSVSGGSIAAGLLASFWPRALEFAGTASLP